MKTLLLTTAAAVTISLAAPGAFADHDRHDHDGQDAVAYGYGNGYSYGFNGNNYNSPVNNRFVPGYTPLNSGWSVGAFNPDWNSGFRAGCNNGLGPNRGCNTGYGSSVGYRVPQQTGILPGGCYRIGRQTVCPNNRQPGGYYPVIPYGTFSPLR